VTVKKLPDLPCQDCGKPAGRGKGGMRRKVCFECSVTRARVAALQMHMRAGAAYDQWRNSAGPLGRPRRDSAKG